MLTPMPSRWLRVTAPIAALVLLVPVSALADVGSEETGEQTAEEAVVEAPAPVDDPVGGWAVVDPATGQVMGVLVCTESVCGESGEWAGVMPNDTDCPGCLLRKQTNATADGNVAGWRSSEGMDVTYDGDEQGTFTITSDSGHGVQQSMTLVPSETATDPDGMDLHTGIVARRTESRFTEADQNARATVTERRDGDGDLETDRVVIEFEDWDREFSYDTAPIARERLAQDVEDALASEGASGAEANDENDEAGDVVLSAGPEAEEEPSALVQAIRDLTQRVVSFLGRWFRG